MAMLLVDRPFSEEKLGESAELDLRNVGPKVWPTVLSRCSATNLCLYNVTLSSLALSLAHIRLADDDITVLSRCSGLRRLQVPNQFEMEQVAFLAKRFGGQLLEPLSAHRPVHPRVQVVRGRQVHAHGSRESDPVPRVRSSAFRSTRGRVRTARARMLSRATRDCGLEGSASARTLRSAMGDWAVAQIVRALLGALTSRFMSFEKRAASGCSRRGIAIRVRRLR